MKLIFLDADGTLFHHEGYIPDSAIKACIQAQNNGHKIILCTGRQKAEIFGDMLKVDYDAIIAGSGATIECDHKTIEENIFSKDQRDHLVNYLESNQIPACFETRETIYASKETKNIMYQMMIDQTKGKTKEEAKKHAMSVLYYQTEITDDPKNLKFSKVSFIQCHVPYNQVYSDLKDKFDVIPATFAPLGKESGEIGSYDITKGTGVKSVIQYFKANIKDTIAIGDGHNDFKMFENVNYSIAMGNAPDEVKAKANDVTTSLENDGIYNAFKKLNLI